MTCYSRGYVGLQLISWESICEAEVSKAVGETGGRGRRRGASLRSLALAVFSQCRRQLQHLTNIKSLTGFGTAANADLFLKNKDVSLFRNLYKSHVIIISFFIFINGISYPLSEN